MKTEWVTWALIAVIILTLIGVGFYAGRKSIKPPSQIHIIDTVTVVKTDTVSQTIYKYVSVKPDTVYIDSSKSYLTYTEVIDTIVTFSSDSLDFVAEIIFDDSLKSFQNTFDLQLRVKKIIEEVWREVPISYPPELYQEPLVITLMLVIAFLSGLAL